MPENVVYVLGAGFSAPLGLPVMRNFLVRSKDLFAAEPERFAHFAEVFDKIDRMHKAKSYYHLDLFNIEEILSVLEMEEYVSGTRHRSAFVKYLADVISALTPEPELRRALASRWTGDLFSAGLFHSYATFVGALFNLKITTMSATDRYSKSRQDSGVSYGVITLNYDMVLERSLNAINWQCQEGPDLHFATAATSDNDDGVPLAKLHGSVEPLTIVPPTWQKGATNEVLDAWQLAQKLLATATQLRIVGYSLPDTDSYIRYLLASGAIAAPHLKAIDVLCLDPTGEVRDRYEAFVDFYDWRFGNVDTSDYLKTLDSFCQPIATEGHRQTAKLDQLETAHQRIMEKYAHSG